MKRQLKLKQAKERKSQQEHERSSWQYIYTRALRVREAQVLASERDKINLIENARKETGEDANALTDMKKALADIFREVTMLEACVRLPSIDFGRLDFLKCVLQLRGSEHMAQAELHTDIRSKKGDIRSLWRERLGVSEWDQVQRPYKYPFDELDDIDDIDRAGVTDEGKVGGVPETQAVCSCPDCMIVR